MGGASLLEKEPRPLPGYERVEPAQHYFRFRREEFLAHYHKRSNVETAFSMVKAKFGGAERSRTPVAQVNESLLKFICHNTCVLIQESYELGIAAVFARDTTLPKNPN